MLHERSNDFQGILGTFYEVLGELRGVPGMIWGPQEVSKTFQRIPWDFRGFRSVLRYDPLDFMGVPWGF